MKCTLQSSSENPGQGRHKNFQKKGAQLKKNPVADKVHTQNVQNFGIFKEIEPLGNKWSSQDRCLAPLLHFSGCQGTPGTRTAGAPGVRIASQVNKHPKLFSSLPRKWQPNCCITFKKVYGFQANLCLAL